MNTYYFYRMTCDTGNAPCVFNKKYAQSKLLTLACCKGGQIRHYNGQEKNIKTGLRHTVGIDMKSNPNDSFFVIGILNDRIVYAAKIKDAILMTDYFSNSKYRNRMDCIYDVNMKSDWKLSRRKNFNLNFHGLDYVDQHHHDELGEYVLISDEFIYQGKNTDLMIPAEIKELMPKHQETKRYSDLPVIANFVEFCLINGKRGNFEPIERLDEKNCALKGCQK